ncbi:two-component system, OmpR family, response regulator MprA [Rubritalea squalenifaciens DSM 18772]|uniref:Two-component system, OmpR family, response regulator MprA n=1 Tax=Rubritalea squalenifaciens DSM 18772 TaxID=1123071 RepID=A0A1M6GZ65_9BACT|nr:response regulator transcription factor [Rubritalea squalenifaciens]SHJ15220.1 two-component system, OmpR family, response regulator MprA [Rubritalea squalenifaciens DSM 18772]
MHIVVIEDEPDLGSILKEILEMEGHHVELMTNGRDGLNLALHAQPDLVLIDVMLPELNGWEVLKALRRKSDVPVLMLTAMDATQDRVRGLDLGADDYQTKPFEVEELQARVRALLRRKTGSSTTKIEFAPRLTFCQKERKVTKDGEEVSLTSRELALLEYFIQNQGRTLTRTMIDERFIDYSDAESDVLSVLIYRLRKKLGSNTIKTRRGLGFELPKFSHQ